MQLFAKFKKILWRGFRATLNFWKFKVALNSLRRIVLNFTKSCFLSCWLQSNNKKWGSPSLFLSYKCSKLKLRVFLAGHIVAMITYSAPKLTATYSPMIVQFVDTMMLVSTSIGYNDPSNSKSWKVLETVSSHLKLLDPLSCQKTAYVGVYVQIMYFKKW